MLMLCWEGDQENVDDDGGRSGGDDDDDGIYQWTDFKCPQILTKDSVTIFVNAIMYYKVRVVVIMFIAIISI